MITSQNGDKLTPPPVRRHTVHFVIEENTPSKFTQI